MDLCDLFNMDLQRHYFKDGRCCRCGMEDCDIYETEDEFCINDQRQRPFTPSEKQIFSGAVKSKELQRAAWQGDIEVREVFVENQATCGSSGKIK